MMRKVKIRTPAGKIAIHFKKRKTQPAKCASCGKILHGVPRVTSTKIKKLSKSEKRPTRIFGGYFCPACTEALLRERARQV